MKELRSSYSCVIYRKNLSRISYYEIFDGIYKKNKSSYVDSSKSCYAKSRVPAIYSAMREFLAIGQVNYRNHETEYVVVTMARPRFLFFRLTQCKTYEIYGFLYANVISKISRRKIIIPISIYSYIIILINDITNIKYL